MAEKKVLMVQTLGNLKINYQEKTYPPRKKRSIQLELLLVYLIINRHQSINNRQLINLLWSNGQSNQPQGALRNLIYRVRKEMHQLLDSNQEAIVSRQHSYMWNQDIICQVDLEQIFDYCQEMLETKDVIQQYQLALKVLDLYHHDFLMESKTNPWVKKINDELKDKIVTSFNLLLTNLKRHQQYLKILELTTHHKLSLIEDDDFFYQRLNAYCHLKMINEGLNYYRRLVDYYYGKGQLSISKRYLTIYQQLLKQLPQNQSNINDVVGMLNNNEVNNQAFYLDYDVFKSIYNLYRRDGKRTHKKRILALLTVYQPSESFEGLNNETNLIKEVIETTLRKNDVFTKMNPTQFALLLDCQNINQAKMAIKRIQKTYQQSSSIKLVIKYDLKVIK